MSDTIRYFILLCVLFAIGESSAQVVIKERVDINVDSAASTLILDLESSGDAIWVAPAAGTWILRVNLVTQALAQISPSARFDVTTSDSIFSGNVLDWVSHSESYWHVWENYCTGRDTFALDDRIRGVVPYDKSLPLRVASVGDTIRFRYYSDFGSNDSAKVYHVWPNWIIGLGKNHPCIPSYWWIEEEPDYCELYLSYGGDHIRYAVATLQDTISFGDSLEFRVIAMNGSGRETIPEDSTLLMLRISPPEYGMFILNNDTLPSPLDSISYEDARAGRVRFLAAGTSPDSVQPVAIEALQVGDSTKRGSDTIYVKGEVIEILLGETKYIQAKNNPGGLVFEHQVSEPTSPGSVADAQFSLAQVSGDRFGTYYEYKKADGTALPQGWVRVVGRYWMPEPAPKYVVRLTAVSSSLGKSGKVEIEVTEPSALGATHNSEQDVFGQEFDLDSLVVSYAGKHGIPPQLIKGLIDRESDQFNPSYRWEPFFDAWHVQIAGGRYDDKRFMEPSFRYRVNPDGTVGSPAPPTNHTNLNPNLTPQSYFGYQGTAWNLFYQYCRDVNPNANWNLYPKKRRVWYDTPLERWNQEYDATLLRLRRTVSDPQQRRTLALNEANTYLRDEWQEGILGTATAQTRSASSYGLMQMMYTTAVKDRQYPMDTTGSTGPLHLPEYLNINDTLFAYSVPYLLDKVQQELLVWNDGNSSWHWGWEWTFVFALNRYNGGDATSRFFVEYGRDILQRSTDYLPQTEN